jgi:hypothetical protein
VLVNQKNYLNVAVGLAVSSTFIFYILLIIHWQKSIKNRRVYAEKQSCVAAFTLRAKLSEKQNDAAHARYLDRDSKDECSFYEFLTKEF